ncbi:MAG: hypothetical protein HY791_14860 [Deltaproteobacteria bacterium]|nr:hypothetical protein [Deltaproteobacteria bacterium]
MSRFVLPLIFLAASCGERERDSTLRGTPELDVSSSTVGAEGGMVSLDDVLVGVPTAALPAPVELSIAELDESTLTALPTGLARAGQAYAFLPHGQTFQQAVTIELPFAGASDGIAVLRLDDENDTDWEQIASVDFDGSKAVFESTHFSVYVTARASGSDAGVDASVDGGRDGGPPDGGSDGGDVGPSDGDVGPSDGDVGPDDGGFDGGPSDSATDAGDGGFDGGPDASDGGFDGGPPDASDGGFDAGPPDGGSDVGPNDGGPSDAMPDSGADGGSDAAPPD